MRSYFFGYQTKKQGPPIKEVAIRNMEEKLRRKIIVSDTQMPTHPPLHGATPTRPSAKLTRVEPKYTMIHRSGLVAIYQLGDTASKECSGSAWQFRPQRAISGIAIRLCPGFTGRFIFGAQSEFPGRCFEWQVVVDKTDSPLYVGKPKFQLWELEPNALGLLERTTTAISATSPNSMWDQAYKQILQRAGCTDGARMCGLQDPVTVDANVEIADLMALAGADPARLYGLRKHLDCVSDRWKRHMSSATMRQFEKAMKAICPSDPHLAFGILLESAAFQAEWYPDATLDDLMRMPFVMGMVRSYNDASSKQAKLAILSLFAPYFQHRVTISLFGVTPCQVTQAKLHDADGNAGITLSPIVHRRMRLAPRTFAFLYQWCRSSFAVTAGCPSHDNLVRLEIRRRLHPRYKAMAEKEGVVPVALDHFNVHMRDGFQDETVESCCCNGCIDGWVALNMLDDFVMEPLYQFPNRRQLSKRVIAIMDFFKGDYRWRHLAESSQEAQHCMQLALGCNKPALCVQCDHEHTNTCLQCNMYPALIMECELHISHFGSKQIAALQATVGQAVPEAEQVVPEAEQTVPEAEQTAPATAEQAVPTAGQAAPTAKQAVPTAEQAALAASAKQVAPAVVEQVDIDARVEQCKALTTSMQEHLRMIDGEIKRYQAHIVRKHKASKGQMDLMSYVTVLCAMCYIDYKMKILPSENKNAQSTSFGQRGKSLFDAVMVFKIPADYTGEIPKGIEREGDFCIAYQRVAADDADQDFVHSVQVFEIAMRFFKKQYPWVEEFLLYSDGAGNFRSLSFEIAMAERMAEIGVKVNCHLLPEAGDGKDRADRDFAGVNILLQSWLKRRKASCQNATEIYEALQYGKRPGDGVTNCAVVINKPDHAPAVDTVAFAKKVGKARDNMYYTEFNYVGKPDGTITLGGARFFAYYKMGEGVYLNRSELDQLWPDKPIIATAKIIAGSQVSAMVPVMKPKMERSREGKKEDSEKKQDAKRRKVDAAKDKDGEEARRVKSRQRSKMCCTCDRSFMHESNQEIHQKACPGNTTLQSRQAHANLANTFGSLEGAAVEITDSTLLPVPQDDGYKQWIGENWCWDMWLSLVADWAAEQYANSPKHLEDVTKVLKSTIISPQMETACAAHWAAGWATKEQCRRPSISFPIDVVNQLRFCFDTVPRMNAYEIRKHLMHIFTLGPKVLRISQISGWVSSEVKRRKERLMKAAAGLAVSEEAAAMSEAEKQEREQEEATKQKEKDATKQKEKDDKAAAKQKKKDDKTAAKQKEKDDKTAAQQKEKEQKEKEEGAEDTEQDTQAAGKREGKGGAAKRNETEPKANRKRKTTASKEKAQAAPIESEKGTGREVLMLGNVWARVCCRRQVAARLYDDSKGCQGEAVAACEEQKEILAALPRYRKQKIWD